MNVATRNLPHCHSVAKRRDLLSSEAAPDRALLQPQIPHGNDAQKGESRDLGVCACR